MRGVTSFRNCIYQEKNCPVASSQRLQTGPQSKNKAGAQRSACRQAPVLTSFQLSLGLSMLKRTCLRPLLSRRHQIFSRLTNTSSHPPLLRADHSGPSGILDSKSRDPIPTVTFSVLGTSIPGKRAVARRSRQGACFSGRGVGWGGEMRRLQPHRQGGSQVHVLA